MPRLREKNTQNDWFPCKFIELESIEIWLLHDGKLLITIKFSLKFKHFHPIENSGVFEKRLKYKKHINGSHEKFFVPTETCFKLFSLSALCLESELIIQMRQWKKKRYKLSDFNPFCQIRSDVGGFGKMLLAFIQGSIFALIFEQEKI